ncbi:nucleotidyltransferase family protein [Candidatus Fermentibacteria bacterium]|nr:nucleotidyltransferase family protein [Candidatus Fermentibacteria bacterium]
MNATNALTSEEQLVLAAVGAGISAEHQETVNHTLEQGVVWRGVQFLAERNNAGSFLHRALRNVPGELVPEQVQTKFRQIYLATFQRNQEFAHVISHLSETFGRADTRAVFLRGLVLAERVYGNPSLRRFADIDVLVQRDDVPRALLALEGAGGVPRRGTLSNGYYYRNHFHLERVMGNGQGSTVELHWNLDHRYTLFTIDVAGLIDRSLSAQVGSACVQVLSPVDDILGLCLHAVKHCPAIRHFPSSPLLPRRILLDGWLTQLVDVAMALRWYTTLDWDLVVASARSWGAEASASGAFTAVQSILGISPPEPVLQQLRMAAKPARFGRSLVRAFVDPATTLQPLDQRRPLTRLILTRWRFQEDAVFHPVRLLDLLNYFAPSRQDLARWFGKPRLRPFWWWWARHAAVSSLRLLAGLVDLVASRLAVTVRNR